MLRTVLVSFCCCIAVSASAALHLQVSADGTNIVLAWPTNAVGYRAQSRIGLSLGESWSDLNLAPSLAGPVQQLIFPLTNSQQFFRLIKDSGTNPSVNALMLSTNAIAFGSTAILGFDIIDTDIDLVALELTWTNVLGSFSNIMSTASIGLTGLVSRADLPIRAEKLPAGTSYFTLRLLDATGLYSEPVFFGITIVGQSGPGTAPQLVSATAETNLFGLSFNENWRLKPGFVLNWNDADGDVERIRATLHLPTGEVAVQELPAIRAGFTNVGGMNSLRPFTLNYFNPPGIYSADFQLIDRTGRTSEVRTVEFQLDYSAAAPPEISGFSPVSGAPGSEVYLFGSGLTGAGTNFQVLLAGVPCTVTASASYYISLLVPTGAVTAPFKMVSEAQVNASPSSFIVPPVILLTSDREAAAPGEPIQFLTSFRGATNRSVTFFVNGIPGGNPTEGVIRADGLYHLPMLPPTNLITIVAALTTQPAISATSFVQVLPPVSIGGTIWVSSAQGGSVSTTDGDATLDIPPGALPTNTFLNIAVLHGTNLPPPAAGRRLLGGVRLGPGGIIFNQPVSVTVPLAEKRSPGTVVALKYFIRATSTFVNEGLTATVAANGREAVGQILHFSEVVADEADNVVPSGPPQITSVRAQSDLQEGVIVPVLITGQNLVPGLRIEVLRDGQPTGDVVPSNAIFETNRLGLLLTISTLRDLDVNERRDYQLRVINSSNQSASTNLSITGLNELMVPPGAHTNLFGLGHYSEADIGAGATVTVSGALTMQVNGPVHISGRIVARGGNGAASVDEAPGTNRFFTDFTRRGGDGGKPDEYGHDGSLQFFARGNFYYGDGGAPGEDISSIESFFIAIFHLVTCITSVNPGSCGAILSDVIGGIIDLVGDSNDMEVGKAVGRPGFPGARAPFQLFAGNGHGGGGGGGGGDLNLVDAGEGGGAGGHGGLGVVVITRGDLLMDGQVETTGGDGGDGGENIVTTFTGGGVDFQDTPSANRGGGGGGGSGGNIFLLARGGYSLGDSGGFNAFGGNPGNSLFLFRTVDINSQIISTQMVRIVDANYPETPSGYIQTQGYLVPPRILPDFVTDRALLQLDLPPAPSAFSPTVMLTITGEETNQVREVSFARTDSGRRRANLLFFPGFNTISFAFSDGRVLDHPMLHRQVLYLAGPDSDGDGLSDADEAVLGSNPAVADTDADGVNDFDEALLGLSPITGDSDGDLISDSDELNGGTNPGRRDSDGDGFWDGWELVAGTSATNVQTSIPPLPQGTLFAEVISSINGRVLAVVDPGTGKMFALGRVNGGVGFGIAFTPTGEMLASRGDHLVKLLLDRPSDASGQITVTNIGNLSTNGAAIYCYSLASSAYAGKMIGIESTVAGESTGQFLSIDPSTGLATRIGIVQPQPLHALAVLKSGSTQEMLFAASAQSGASDLFQAFPSGPDGAAQSLAILNWTNVYGLTAAGPDRLHLARTGNGTTDLLLINTTNSAITLEANLAAPVFDLALATCPVPCFNGPFLSPLINPGGNLVTADFNGDTLPDLAVSVTRTVNNEEVFGVNILHGRGDGTFTNSASYFFINAHGFGGSDIALADVNGDGRKDIVMSQAAVFAGVFHTLVRPAELMTVLADNQGGFQAPIIQAMGAGPAQTLGQITAGDWSGDGLADLIFVNEAQQAYSFQGSGSGSFTNSIALLPGTVINNALLADVNGDARPDFVGVGTGLTIRLADADGGFLPSQNFAGDGGARLNVGDVDGDSDQDVVATGYGAVPIIFYNNGAGEFPTKATFFPRVFSNGVFARAAIGDLTGDGRADAVVPSNGTRITAFISGQAPVTLAHTMNEPIAAPFEAGRQISNSVIVDANKDGLPDVIMVGGNAISVLLGEPSF